MRLIDADALKKQFEELHLHPDLIELIDHAPTVAKDYDTGYQDGLEDELNDIRPQGEWLTFSTNHSIIQCSECTALLNNLRADIFKDKIGKMNFCPNCGAKMQKGGKE